jgi:hypothetical protein
VSGARTASKADKGAKPADKTSNEAIENRIAIDRAALAALVPAKKTDA